MNRYVDLKYPNLMFTMLYDILDVFFIHSNGQKSVQQLAYIKNGYVHCMYTGGLHIMRIQFTRPLNFHVCGEFVFNYCYNLRKVNFGVIFFLS